ncbi:exodeoxyribonuclease VII large subunit [Bacteriovoracaceae bacterium]|nr:exodeoxyribonuclease VII large subunit [Bacteriovoracaceae bacterium]
MLKNDHGKPLSISEFIHLIKDDLESKYFDVHVSGEVSNLTRSTAGHWYFSLKDKRSTLSLALFRFEAMRNPLINKIKDGDLIEVKGEVSVYAARGVFQLIAKKINYAGEGDLFQQYLQLKENLKSEGLFNSEIKKAIPKFARKIGLITAKKSAAEADFINIVDRRTFQYEILMAHSTMQGSTAPNSVIKQLKLLSKIKDLDVVVITRGGGSFEDLFCFNNEELVRFVSNYKIPVVSAIGHQVDSTLLDFVADFKCETPSAAAELISDGQFQLKNHLQNIGHKLLVLMKNLNEKIKFRSEKLSPHSMLKLIKLKQRTHQQKLELYFRTLSRKKAISLNEKNYILDQLIARMLRAMASKNKLMLDKAQVYHDKLLILSPQNILQRGYSIVQLEDKKVIKNAIEFKKNMKENSGKVFVQFSDKTINIGSLNEKN